MFGFNPNVITPHLMQGGHSFVYNADIGLRKWRAAKARLDSGADEIVNVNVVGDSITMGCYASDWLSKGFCPLLNSMFATKYQDVGDGVIHWSQNNGAINVVVPIWTYTGGPFSVTTGGGFPSSKVSYTPNDVITLSFNGDIIDLLILNGTNYAPFEVYVDAEEAQSFNSAGVKGVQKITFTPAVPADTHILTITNKTTTSQLLCIMGAIDRNVGKGVRVNKFGYSGSTVGEWLRSTVDTTDPIRMVTEYTPIIPTVTILAFTANDYDDQTDLAAYKTSLQTWITAAKNAGDCILASVGPWNKVKTIPQIQYVNIMKELAIANGCCFVDIYSRWGGAVAAQNTYGYITDPFLSVHPNDYGHQDIATVLWSVLNS